MHKLYMNIEEICDFTASLRAKCERCLGNQGKVKIEFSRPLANGPVISENWPRYGLGAKETVTIYLDYGNMED